MIRKNLRKSYLALSDVINLIREIVIFRIRTRTDILNFERSKKMLPKYPDPHVFIWELTLVEAGMALYLYFSKISKGSDETLLDNNSATECLPVTEQLNINANLVSLDSSQTQSSRKRPRAKK